MNDDAATSETWTDEIFLKALEDRTLPLRAFNHAAHLRAGYLYLTHLDFAEALVRMRRSIRQFASHHGQEGLYHETITVAFMTLINERRAHISAAGSSTADWPTFLAQNQDLLRRDVLTDFYTPSRLNSPLARKTFLLPDRVLRATEAA